jgi:DNA-directed RNA polymerase specialized sigma24 family protein
MEGIHMPRVVCSLEAVPLPDLVAAAQADPEDNSPAMNEIVRRFQSRLVFLATTLTARTSLHDDLVQVALMALVKAVRRHDPKRAGFTTYARRYMLGAAMRLLKIETELECESMSEPTTAAVVEALVAPSPEPGTYMWGFGAAGRIVRGLPPRQRELLTHRYIEDASLAEIAAITGTSIPAVSQRLATAHRTVKARLVA